MGLRRSLSIKKGEKKGCEVSQGEGRELDKDKEENISVKERETHTFTKQRKKVEQILWVAQKDR